jgi:hypothetical protein
MAGQCSRAATSASQKAVAKAGANMTNEYEKYETKEATIGIPRKWFKQCIDNETDKLIVDLRRRVRSLERRVMILERGGYA